TKNSPWFTLLCSRPLASMKCCAPQRVKRISGDTWITSTFTLKPAPMTKPRVVLVFSSAGLEVEVVMEFLVMVWVRPLNVSQATPASTYGCTIFVENRYFASSGNSQALAVALLLVTTPARVP